MGTSPESGNTAFMFMLQVFAALVDLIDKGLTSLSMKYTMRASLWAVAVLA